MAEGGTRWLWPLPADIEELCEDVGTNVAGWIDGVGGPLDSGETGSVIHIRWLFVATSLATVCASVLMGVTWNTGKESLPSCMPRVLKMTEIKCMHVFRRSGSEEDFVSSFTSTVEIFPTTLWPLSTTGSDETPSLSRRVKASVSGRSPLQTMSAFYRANESGPLT